MSPRGWDCCHLVSSIIAITCWICSASHRLLSLHWCSSPPVSTPFNATVTVGIFTLPVICCVLSLDQACLSVFGSLHSYTLTFRRYYETEDWRGTLDFILSPLVIYNWAAVTPYIKKNKWLIHYESKRKNRFTEGSACQYGLNKGTATKTVNSHTY